MIIISCSIRMNGWISLSVERGVDAPHPYGLSTVWVSVAEIADRLGVRVATVSRRLKRAEEASV